MDTFDGKLIKLILRLKWCEPQDTICYERAPGIWRISLLDRIGRREQYTGEHVGYGTFLFKPNIFPPLTRIVVQGDLKSASYRSRDGITSPIEILLRETIDI